MKPQDREGGSEGETEKRNIEEALCKVGIIGLVHLPPLLFNFILQNFLKQFPGGIFECVFYERFFNISSG